MSKALEFLALGTVVAGMSKEAGDYYGIGGAKTKPPSMSSMLLGEANRPRISDWIARHNPGMNGLEAAMKRYDKERRQGYWAGDPLGMSPDHGIRGLERDRAWREWKGVNQFKRNIANGVKHPWETNLDRYFSGSTDSPRSVLRGSGVYPYDAVEAMETLR